MGLVDRLTSDGSQIAVLKDACGLAPHDVLYRYYWSGPSMPCRQFLVRCEVVRASEQGRSFSYVTMSRSGATSAPQRHVFGRAPDTVFEHATPELDALYDAQRKTLIERARELQAGIELKKAVVSRIVACIGQASDGALRRVYRELQIEGIDDHTPITPEIKAWLDA